MTTINCSSNCIYQQDGLCGKDNSENAVLSYSPECVFFRDKSASENNKTNEKGVFKNG